MYKVTYNAAGFLDKNRDTFFDDLKALCFTSKSPVLVEIFEVIVSFFFNCSFYFPLVSPLLLLYSAPSNKYCS